MSEFSVETMARLLREHMDKTGISQAEFARRVGVSQKHLSQVLNGKATPRLAQLDYWAHALHMRWSIRLVKA